MEIARIGLFFDGQAEKDRWSKQENVFEKYAIEVLEHARVPFQVIDDISDFHKVDVLIVGIADEGPHIKAALIQYASSGGTIISYAGLEFLSSDLGCKVQQAMGTGYADLAQDYAEGAPLRYLEAKPWEAPSSDTVYGVGKLGNDEQSPPALLHIPVGLGSIERWAVNIPKTIVNLQQGTAPITIDGAPAPDGSANLDEGILKADDGFKFDWTEDREFTKTGMPYFSVPHADLWREVMVGHLVRSSLEKGLLLPVIEHWPADVNHVAMISFDSDMNIHESAEVTLELLKDEDVQTTWCIIAPGFSEEVYEKVKEDGHELAFHYNALEMEDGVWSKQAFSEQLDWLRTATNENGIKSNKNHYTRFEGWGELFQWCEQNGIEVDQTRGPSKKGNVGFLFGTCQPYFPISLADERNRFYDVLEIGFLTQDMNHPALADTTIIHPFLEKVKRVNGVGHFLFHQYHILNIPEVKDAITYFIREAKAQGFTFWTSRQINEWERARRSVNLSVDGGFHIYSRMEMPDLAVWMPSGEVRNDEEYVYKFGLAGKRRVMKVQTNTVEL